MPSTRMPRAELLLAHLMPTLTSKRPEHFNVFSVMRHGTHEKQLSNVFAWLLDETGSHQLGDLFVTIFIDEVNARLDPHDRIASAAYSVAQEVNTSPPGEPMDIADIVMTATDSVIVIENYFISDGHGHSYERYRNYAARDGKRPVVVLLCQYLDAGLLVDGWQRAPAVTYPRLLKRLLDEIARRPQYMSEFANQYSFLQQMHQYFVKEMPVDTDLISFIATMCEADEAARFRGAAEIEGKRLAEDLQAVAIERLTLSRDLLQRIKAALRTRVAPRLIAQVNEAARRPVFADVDARYQGIYQWTINLHPSPVADDDGASGRADEGRQGVLQIKFGPSAWFANSQDDAWRSVVPEPDYSRLFLTWRETVWQSQVSLEEIASGLEDDDNRLRDEILALLNADR